MQTSRTRLSRVSSSRAGPAAAGAAAGGGRLRAGRAGAAVRRRCGRLPQADEAGGDEAVEDLRRVEDREAAGRRDRLDAALAVDLREDQPLAGVEVDLPLAAVLDHELRDHLRGRDLLGEHAPLVEPPRRLHEQVRVALGDRPELGGDPGLEPEVALAPDGEGVDGLLARRVVELGVDDLARRSGRSGP